MAAISFLPCPVWARDTDRPNIIVIIADDLGYADLAFLTHAPADVRQVGTPALNRLAQAGTYFTDAYATSPICSPSRCGLITGRYQQRWGNYWYSESGIRIPLMASYPGTLPTGKTCPKLASAMDIVPTLVELAGGTPPDNLDGRSLLPLIREQHEEHHSQLCWSDGRDAWGIRRGPWKLIHSAGWTHAIFKLEDGFAVRDPEPYVYPEGLHLFNLHEDIGELSINRFAFARWCRPGWVRVRRKLPITQRRRSNTATPC